MKKHNLALILFSYAAFAEPDLKEINDKNITQKFLTVVKDGEVEKMLAGSSEFSDCKKDYEFISTDDEPKKTKKLQDATDCFKKKIANTKGEALYKMADELKLESHGLIKSKNVQDITNYLSSKMTKALTGRDPNEKDPKKILESMKWKNHKSVDQKVFIDLYTNQLVKNALYEVSRFCFENLRINTPASGSSPGNFSDQWALMRVEVEADGTPKVASINDTGVPSYFDVNKVQDINNKKGVYASLVSGLTAGATPINGDDYKDFFNYCQKSIPLLCNEFKQKSTAVQNSSANKITTIAVQNSSANKIPSTSSATMSNGANACLTMERLQNIKVLMANTAKVAKQFDERGENKGSFAIQMLENSKVYQRGKGEGEESLDEITSFSSTDMLESNKENELDDLYKKCKTTQGQDSECEEYLVTKDESLDKAIFVTEANMNLKRELEKARVKELATKKVDDLKKYLEDNGHYDLLNKLNDNLMPPAEMEAEIGKIYDARKVAEIESLKLKVGKRQISEAEEKNALAIDPNAINEMKLNNIKDSKEERARMAQVMMFNNIITSQLNLVDSSGKEVGRNLSGWNKELKGFDSNKVDTTLFTGIQDDAEKNGNKMDDTSIAGGGIIDMILGKKEDKKP